MWEISKLVDEQIATFTTEINLFVSPWDSLRVFLHDSRLYLGIHISDISTHLCTILPLFLKSPVFLPSEYSRNASHAL